MTSLKSCIRRQDLDPQDMAEVQATMKANGGDEAAAVQSLIDSLRLDLNDVRGELSAQGFDMRRRTVTYSQSAVSAVVGGKYGGVIEMSPGLTPEERAIEARFANWILEDVSRAIDEYGKLDGSKGGKLINTDVARDLSPDYAASKESRARLAGAVHEPASWLSKEIYKRRLTERPTNGDRNKVFFTAGGAGSGKSSAIDVIPDMKETSDTAHIIYDTNMNTLKSSVDKIEQALLAGKGVYISYVVRDPIKSLTEGALPRAEKSGRTVPLVEHAKTHEGSAEVVKKLIEKYKKDDRVRIAIVDNRGPFGSAKEAGIDVVEEMDYNNLLERLKVALDEEYANGRISKAVYDGTMGIHATEEGVGRDEQAAQRGAQEAPPGSQRQDAQQHADTGDGTLAEQHPAQRTVLKQEQAGAPRGSISFPETGAPTIRLFESADLSTVIHEMGHHFLTMFKRDVERYQNPQDISDFKALTSWWSDNAIEVARAGKAATGTNLTAAQVKHALLTGSTGNTAMDAAIEVGVQELTARGFEDYTMKGEAPSLQLRNYFSRVKAWMMSVYRRAKSTGSVASPEVQKVFDRWLATDIQLAEAKLDMGGDKMTFATAEQYGMKQADFDKLLALYEASQVEAEARLIKKTMAPYLAQQKEAYKEERKRVEQQVTEEVAQEPLYRAIQQLRYGTDWNGNELAPVKLHKQTIIDRYGVETLNRLPGMSADGKAVKTSVVKADGIDPEVAADMFGYPNGDAFINALVTTPPIADVIQTKTDQVMAQNHPDPLLDDSGKEDALDAAHTDTEDLTAGRPDKKAQFLAAELRALEVLAGRPEGISWQMARQLATEALQHMEVNFAMKPHRFLAAERKAAQLVAQLAERMGAQRVYAKQAVSETQVKARAAVKEGDAKTAATVETAAEQAAPKVERANVTIDQLLEAKIQQIINHALHAGSRNVEREVTRLTNKMEKLNRPDSKLAKRTDIDFIKAARAIAAKYGLAEADDAFQFVSWARQITQDNPVRAQALQHAIGQFDGPDISWKKLSVWELGGLNDAIDNLLTIGRTERELQIGTQRVNAEAAVAEMAVTLNTRSRDSKGNLRPPPKPGTWKAKLASLIALGKRAEAYLRDLDDGQRGAFTKYIFQPMEDALVTFRVAKHSKLMSLLDIINPRKADLLSAKPIAAPEINFQFENKGALLMALLHTGNLSNLNKLLLGRNWGTLNPDQTLDSSKFDRMMARFRREGVLTKADYETAQRIWDLLETTKGPANRTHKQINGFYFKAIENQRFTNEFGSFRGGYIPAVRDAALVRNITVTEAQARLDMTWDAAMFPTTGAGFTKERNAWANNPLSLDFMLLPSHLDKVLRYTHVEPTVRQTAAILHDRHFQDAMNAFDPNGLVQVLDPWLGRAARQMYEEPTNQGATFDSLWRTLRQRSGLTIMALNVVNALQQVTGIASAMVIVHPRYMVPAMIRAMTSMGTMRSDMMTLSPYMRTFSNNANVQLMQRIEDIIDAPTVLGSRTAGAANEFIKRNGYFMQTLAQDFVNLPIWHAAYDQEFARSKDGDAAIKEADSAVRRSQGDFTPESMAGFEAGSSFAKMFTMFTSYFSVQANLVGGEMATTMRTLGWHGAPKMFWLYLMGVMIPAVAAQALSLAARGELLKDQDDDGTMLDDLLSMFVTSQLTYIASMIPYAGQVASSMVAKLDNIPYNDRIQISPVVSAYEKGSKALNEGVAAIYDPRKSPTAVSDGLTLLSLVTGIPTGQLAKTLQYGASVATGQSRPENVIDIGRGILTGRDTTTTR